MTAWTFEYNGFIFGDGFSACVTEITGLDMPPVRTGDVVLAGAHGSLPGMDRLDMRTVNMGMDIQPVGETLFTALHRLSGATAVRDDELPLTLQLDESIPEMILYCRVRRRNIPVTRTHIFDFVHADLQFEATDPLLYSSEEFSTNSVAQSILSGWSYDWSYVWDYGVGAISDPTISAYNAGTAPAPWMAIVQGPCVDPSIVGPNGDAVTWAGTLSTNETLVFDAHPSQLTVLLNGSSSRYAEITSDTVWFQLQPGSNEVRLQTSDGNGTITYKWRSAWWSAT